MKVHYPILLAAAMMFEATAQEPGRVVVEETVIESGPAVIPAEAVARERLNAAIARERLAMEPRVLEIPAPAPAPAPTPGTVVETTETETIIETPGMPPRVYNTERNVVIVEGRELPYLTIPVLFVQGTADLLDSESRIAIEETATAIKELVATSPTALFDIEGHTSTEGEDEMNLKLSADRARRVHTELVERYAVPTAALSAHGYGENFPAVIEQTEQDRVLNRRVLVVRVR